MLKIDSFLPCSSANDCCPDSLAASAGERKHCGGSCGHATHDGMIDYLLAWPLVKAGNREIATDRTGATPWCGEMIYFAIPISIYISRIIKRDIVSVYLFFLC
jgi:hypothetical protein